MTAKPMREGTAGDLLPYVELVRAFLRGGISASAYETAFFALFRRQDFTLPADVHPVMQELFFSAEDYVEDDDLRESGELDADGLRRRLADIELRLAEVIDRLPR